MFYSIILYRRRIMSERKTSDAKIRANKKYATKTYKRFAVNTRLEFVKEIEEYKKFNNIESDSGIFNAAMKYCIENKIKLK